MEKAINRPTFDLELKLKSEGYENVIGVDEVGRGALMGSVVSAAVMIPEGVDTSKFNDSKKISRKNREIIAEYIRANCVWGIGQVDESTIDDINILESTMLAMVKAVNATRLLFNSVAVIDGNRAPKNLPIDHRTLISGDTLSLSVAAASIIAKVYRDNMVMDQHKEFPIYGWDKNAGYGTKFHKKAIRLYGPCVYHRKSFNLF